MASAPPDTPLVASPWRRNIGIHLGFVSLANEPALLAALDQVIAQALAGWAQEEGVSWSAPIPPEFSSGPSLADLAAD